MLTINAAQQEALEASALAAFYTRASRFIREHWPELVVRKTEKELHEFVVRCREEALSHGVSTERVIMYWAFLALKVGDKFHQIPRVAQALKANSGEVIIDALMSRVAILEMRGGKR